MTFLLADIGGTTARLALLPPGADRPDRIDRIPLDRFGEAAETIAAWLAAQPGRPWPRGAVIGVAGPVAANRAALTNRGLVFDGAALAAALDLATVRVVNDFAALARSLPMLDRAALFHLGGPPAGDAAAPMTVLGPGTGLGVAALLPPDGVLATEGGHATLAAQDARQAEVIAALHARLGGHVSAERGALSGQGIEALHAALGGDPARHAAEILEAGVAGADARCREAMALFCAMLGGFAGDVALLHGARGGVFIAGGICPRMPEFLAASAFRASFEAKGRFREWLAPVPTWLIRDPEAAAMRGLAVLARDHLGGARSGLDSPARRACPG
jgi:glucokinase